MRCTNFVLLIALATAVFGCGKAAAAAPAQAACEPAAFRVVLDVGHSVEAGGATSARGVHEYVFNLRLAKRIEQSLREAGFARTFLMVTHGVGRGQLKRRAARANELRTDLLISIHHDSVQDSYLGRWEHDGRSDRFSDRFSGYSIFISKENARNAESLEFATMLGEALIGRGLTLTTHHAEDIPGERRPLVDSERGVYRYDELVVLQQTKAPAVLLEAGVIVNRAEETALASPERQRSIAAAVTAAVIRFCDKQAGRRP
jgi:N-acetylmuramoyl-L-alanine amidase